jgi:DNA polymerase-3 subunit epsilon
VLDVETTGLSPRSDRIVEIAVVTTDSRGRPQHEWSSRVNPEGPVGATHIHGITDADVASAPHFAELIPCLNQLLAGVTVAAHNAKFDLAFVRAEYSRAGWALPWVPSLCTLEASDRYLPHLGRRRLVDCCWAYGITLGNAHSALADAAATAGLLAAYLQCAQAGDDRATYHALTTAAATVRWPSAPSSRPHRAIPVPAHVRARPPRPASRPLVELLDRHSLPDALDEGAPSGSLPYLEMLAEALEDGMLTDDERNALIELADAYEMAPQDVYDAHRGFLLALAHQAMDDGKVTRVERTELERIATLLGLQVTLLRATLERAEQARTYRLSQGLRPLSSDWTLGDPVRVGDKVVFTGCDPAQRVDLEARAERLGVRVIGAVSRRVSMLVTDGGFAGTKAAESLRLGVRSVHPDQFSIMLDYLQPMTQPRRTEGTGIDTVEIRRWARANGHEVGSRGRLDSAVVAAYTARVE